MQESSGGYYGRDSGAQGSNMQRPEQRIITILDQTQPQPAQVILTTPIEAGRSSNLGQARFNQPHPVDSDGSASLLHQVNNINNVRSHSRPVEASPSLGVHNPVNVVTSSRPIQRLNPQQLTQDRGQRSLHLQNDYGAHVRSESYTNSNDERARYNRDLTNLHTQSASGFSEAGINEPSGGQLRSIPTASALIYPQQQQAPIRSRDCEIWNEPVPPVLPDVKEFLENLLGINDYNKKWNKCYQSFLSANKDQETASAYANQLLSFQDVGDMVKCLQCHCSHDINTNFVHRQDCPVQRAYSHLQNRPCQDRRSERAPQIGGEQRRQTQNHESYLPLSPDEIAEPSRTGGRHQSSREGRMPPIACTSPVPSQPGSTSEASGATSQGAYSTTQGATGACDMTHVKAVESSGVKCAGLIELGFSQDRIRMVQERFGPISVSSVEVFVHYDEMYEQSIAAPPSINHSQQYHTACSRNANTYQSRGQSLGPGNMQPLAVSSASLHGAQSTSRANLIDASICIACNVGKVRISLYDCGHVVCHACAPDFKYGNSRCKICGEEVISCGAVESSRYRK